jgi:tellurite methyltransferase
MNHSVSFFSTQFEKEIAASQYELNPFERAALPYIAGATLDLGCGLGNLSLAASRAGASVMALDASPQAVGDLQRRASGEALSVTAAECDLSTWVAGNDQYDTVVAIGLLMFFRCETGRALLQQLQNATRPGGVAVVNVLIEGTTFMDMFDPHEHCLFGRVELAQAFSGWNLLSSEYANFDAPHGTLKRFHTVIARRPK